MRKSRVLLLCLAGLGAICGAGAITVHFALASRVESMQRMPDPFASIPASQRPSAVPDAGMTMLLAGVDSGLAVSGTGSASGSADFGRSDALMLARLTADKKHAYVISLPRDSWVTVPGRGETKLNAAMAVGGAGLAVQAVEQLTGLRIDHVAVIDMAGFRGLVDALGGVTIGQQRMNGERALTYVRERQTLPRGDLDRVQHQQELIRAIFDQLSADDTLSSPRRALAVVDAFTRTTTVDPGFGISTMMDLALDSRGLQGNVRFLTAPVKGVGQVGDQSVVFLDTEHGPAFWKAVASDDLDSYLASHPAEVLE